jgi:hypothetical protein
MKTSLLSLAASSVLLASAVAGDPFAADPLFRGLIPEKPYLRQQPAIPDRIETQSCVDVKPVRRVFPIQSTSIDLHGYNCAGTETAALPAQFTLPDTGFTAHEWGTFTSVQGADGVQMDWNPLVVSELPDFVYERNRVLASRANPAGKAIAGAIGDPAAAAKTGLVCRQRMETPVIYFYSDQARTVDVSVHFPQGKITEWYPQKSAADLVSRTAAQAAQVPALRWGKVEILPPASAVAQAVTTKTVTIPASVIIGCGTIQATPPSTTMIVPTSALQLGQNASPNSISGMNSTAATLAATRGIITLGPTTSILGTGGTITLGTTPVAALAPPALPVGIGGSHYYAARETEASLIRTTDETGKAEVEKFLFYRGAGNFTAPLTVKLDSADPQRVLLTNTGKSALNRLFLCQVRADGMAWVMVNRLSAGETRPATIAQAKGTDTASLATALRSALVAEGLYEKEAAAMVKTWESSWLGERGFRVLYTLPRSWTDATLPLAITPSPKEIERVMVGRAEIITPVMEDAMAKAVEQYLAAPAEARPQIVAETRALGLGRFAEPTLRRVMAAEKRAPEFSTSSWELLEKISKPEVTIKTASTE